MTYGRYLGIIRWRVRRLADRKGGKKTDSFKCEYFVTEITPHLSLRIGIYTQRSDWLGEPAF